MHRMRRISRVNRMIAALYVETDGAYYGIPDVDPWDEERDARNYDGPYPVVVHPPCSVWCRYAGLNEKRWGTKRGEDGGMFAHALESVRKYGGVLEHPAYSDAWDAFSLIKPQKGGGWSRSLYDDGWVCHVEQGNYGHRAPKATWLYTVNVILPSLLWGHSDAKARFYNSASEAMKYQLHKNSVCDMLTKRERSATPPAFRDLLLNMARSVKQQPHLRVA